MTSGTIRFIHKNKVLSIHNPDPNETILNFVRAKLGKTGTKEGCAEGGCGACTIVLGELKKSKIIYKAINACIAFVPTLAGKQLILVEDLVSGDGSLHPIQKAMIDYHGSQCGFCTPGFVMSLFAMYKNYSFYKDDIIRDSISGNLCRCTGYRPIIDAAKSLNKISKFDFFKRNQQLSISLLKKIKLKSIVISNKNRKYFAPKNVNELKKILKQYPNSKLLSGGTDVSLVVTKERKDLDSLIYMNSIDELNYIKKNKNYIEVGATTPLIDFELFIKKYFPDFAQILKRYGSTQIRNICTIAGNIATASPIGDTLPLLLSLDSQIIIKDKDKTKILPLNGFFINYRKTKLKKGQFIHSIRIPLLLKSIFKAYKISKRIDDDISSVCASFNVELKNNKVKKIRVAYGGMANIPKRAIYCEKILLNSSLSDNIINKAKKSLEKDFKPITDVRASQKYRMEVAKNLLEKCFLEIKQKKLIRINT
ncbi:MAG: xanthine dehydrogenase small subunit [Pelagibacteraceae bacterium]|nr:xanthine dehydrogenase small subunit [Pelagibacteraceae bacterium]|tara:strand:+ start:17777 stop:19216 length:1440 start_codon:yes stop_codon:yes gene_type:complete